MGYYQEQYREASLTQCRRACYVRRQSFGGSSSAPQLRSGLNREQAQYVEGLSGESACPQR